MTAWAKIGFIIAYTLLIAGASWYTKGRFDDDTARKLAESQQQAIIAQQAVVLQKERAATTITNGVSHAYENKITSIDSAYASVLGGVYAGVNGPSINAGAVPGPTGGYHGAAGATGLSRANKAILVRLAHQADDQTQRLIACQAWVTQQSAQDSGRTP